MRDRIDNLRPSPVSHGRARCDINRCDESGRTRTCVVFEPALICIRVTQGVSRRLLYILPHDIHVLTVHSVCACHRGVLLQCVGRAVVVRVAVHGSCECRTALLLVGDLHV